MADTGFLSARIDQATWLKLAIAILLLIAFSAWAFSSDSPWVRALDAAGGSLPEEKPGLPAVEPQRSIDLLRNTPGGDGARQYLLWQIVDLPFIALNFMVLSLGAALGLKKSGRRQSPLRLILFFPFLYAGAEIGENVFLALFANGALPPYGTPAVLQQVMTSLKMGAWTISAAGGAIGVLTALLYAVFRRR